MGPNCLVSAASGARDSVGAQIGHERRRQLDAAIWLLAVFKQGRHGASHCQTAAIEGVRQPGALVCLDADVAPMCLKIAAGAAVRRRLGRRVCATT